MKQNKQNIEFRYKEKTVGTAKLDWSLISDREDNSNQINKQLVAFYVGLVNLRKSNKAFYSTNLDFLHEDHDAKVLAFQRW
jgi:1,4-alpha-glucan branching enzyme